MDKTVDHQTIEELAQGKIKVKVGEYIFLFEREQFPDWETSNEEERQEDLREVLLKSLHDQLTSIMEKTQATPGEELTETRQSMILKSMDEAEGVPLAQVALYILQTQSVIEGLEDGSIEKMDPEEVEQVEAEYRKEMKKELN